MLSTQPLDDVMVIRLDRAEKRNAMTVAMIRSLAGSIDRASSAKAVVISGAGAVFCAGFDLSACRDDPGVLGDLLDGLAAVTRAMRDHPAPMVVSAHGAALAGGCAIVAAADIAVTHASATLGYPVVRLGISPAVSAPMLRQAAGDGNARVRLLDTKLVDGNEALRLGLVHECVSGGDGGAERCEARAIEIARSLAEKPRHSVAWTKRWCNEIDGSLDRRAIDAALETSLSLVGLAEERELLAQVWARTSG